MVYPCNQCNYKATQQSNLKTHKQSKHEGVKYSCDECEYQEGFQSALKTHKNEGAKCSCGECEYHAAFQSALKTHKQSKHEGVKYYSDECEKRYGPITLPHSSHLTLHQTRSG